MVHFFQQSGIMFHDSCFLHKLSYPTANDPLIIVAIFARSHVHIVKTKIDFHTYKTLQPQEENFATSRQKLK